ncbi:MAG: ABC transporter permease subunit [Thermoplasmatota archaeon]
MRLPLFRAAFRDQQTSMWIYVGVMFAYGLLIMWAYLSVEQTLSDPFSEADDIKLIKIGSEDQKEDLFNLTWETRVGVASHIALGFDSNETLNDPDIGMEDLYGSDMGNLSDLFGSGMDLESLLEEYPFLEPLLGGLFKDPVEPVPLNDTGMELIYFGEGTWVEFTNSGTSNFFMVGLIPNDWNLSNMTFLGPVTSLDLIQKSDFDSYLEDNPMMEAFFGDEIIPFTEVEGFIALEYFSMWPLMLLIFLAIKTGGTVSKHIDDQSIDILLATGYSRIRFLNEKMIVIALNLILVVLGAWAGVILGLLMIGKPVPVMGITVSFLGSIPLALGMIGLSLLLSVLIDENSKTTGAIMGLVIFMFMIQIVSNIAGWQDGLGYISLFTYYNMSELMMDHTIDTVNLVVPSLVGIISIAASYVLFKRKEIHA